jgi:hypothetical protein
MNVFRAKKEPPTEIDFVAAADNGQLNTEKLAAAELKGGVQGHQHHIDPRLEARVVRKMDFRLVPLVMALCLQTISYKCNRSLTILRSTRIS